MRNIKKLFEQYSLPTYNRIGPVFIKGKGSWLWDEQGKRYLDLFPGWGVSVLGHCHPRIIKVINEEVRKFIHLPNNLYFPEQALLAEEIVKSSFPAKVFFANSGAEAVEGAIKFSRLWGRDTNRYEIITMKNSFHGRTFGALSATGQAKYKVPFKPLLPSFKEVPFNDFKAFSRAVNKRTVGVILELIQGEGGINVADREFICMVNEVCRKHRLLFIADEVQTGMGRTGKLFCFQHYGFSPDLMILSKGLGAGVPISALVIRKDIADIIKPGMHASTFGGSPLVTRTAYEVFQVIKEERLLQHVTAMGKYLLGRLEELKQKFSFIKDVRGKGVMAGIELHIEAQPIVLTALQRGLLINATHQTVLRILPSLNVTQRELDQGLCLLADIFREV